MREHATSTAADVLEECKTLTTSKWILTYSREDVGAVVQLNTSRTARDSTAEFEHELQVLLSMPQHLD